MPLAEIYNYQGFRSIYAFPRSLANKIKETRTTRGLRGKVVYSDELFLDFDDNPDAAESFRDFLVDAGYSFSEWDSGGRSKHYHVDLVPMIGASVPQQQKQWVSRNAPGADMSLYHQAAMYRLPGTFHEKHPGRRKELLDVQEGVLLKINEEVKEIYNKPFDAPRNSAQDSADLMVLMLAGAKTGGRHPHVFKLVCCGIRVGLNLSKITHDVLKWNARRCYPSLPEEEVYTYVKKVYTQQTRGLEYDKLAEGQDDFDLQEEGSVS